MNSPLVTILSPCYNVEQFLPKYFETVLGQTYQNLQVVLIDDGSKDNTWQVMQEYAAKDSRVEVYHQENQGVASTRNNLLDKVKGDYVLFIDSDDWIELDMVESLVSLANECHSDFIMCERVIDDTKPRTRPQCIHILSKEEAIHDFLRHEYFIGALTNKLFDSSILHNVKFHCGISYGEDALFCWGVLQNTDNVVVTDRQLYHYRMNDTSISHQTFGEKKLTGHKTWEIITEETKEKWNKYLHIVEARWGMEDFYLLRQAAQGSYEKNNKIAELQKTVRSFIPQMKECGLLSAKEYINIMITCRWYEYGYLYHLLNKWFKR